MRRNNLKSLWLFFIKLCTDREVRLLHSQHLRGIWSGLLTPLVSIQNPGSTEQEEVGPRVVGTFQPRHGAGGRECCGKKKNTFSSSGKKQSPQKVRTHSISPPVSGTLFFQSWNVWTTLGPTSLCILEPVFGYSLGESSVWDFIFFRAEMFGLL